GWMGTDNGICRFQPRSKDESVSFDRFYHNKDDPHSLSNNRVWRIVEDHSHRLWAVTLNGSFDLINSVDNKRVSFQQFFPLKKNELDESQVMLFDLLTDSH